MNLASPCELRWLLTRCSLIIVLPPNSRSLSDIMESFPVYQYLSFYPKTPGDPVGSDAFPAIFLLSVTLLHTFPASWGLGPTSLCSEPCRTAVFHLPSLHITHQIASLDHNLISFSSLKDHSPLLLVFQCLKTVASSIIV